MLLFVIFIELILLYRLSLVVHSYIYFLFTRVTRSKKISLWFYSLVFLPGTFIHEVSHFVMASFFFVGVGEMRLIPQIEGEGIKLGELTIAKTDPIRRFLIGIGPIIIGLGLLLTLLYFVSHNSLYQDWRVILVLGYSVFVVGNTMFSSKKDMEGSWKFFILVFAVVAVLLFFNFPLSSLVNNLASAQAIKLMGFISRYLLVPIFLDIFIVLVARVVGR